VVTVPGSVKVVMRNVLLGSVWAPSRAASHPCYEHPRPDPTPPTNFAGIFRRCVVGEPTTVVCSS
jgi:hypothetical protein